MSVSPQPAQLGKPPEKRSPVNKNVQQINSEEEASVLSRYPFHGNRALPSSKGAAAHVVMEKETAKRWSLIDVNNNRVEVEDDVEGGHGSEIDLMLQPVTECRTAQRSVLIERQKQQLRGKGGVVVPGRPKRQLTSIRSHSSGGGGHSNKVHYKSPPMKRYSNVYDYTYMSDPSLNAIYEDSDSQ